MKNNNLEQILITIKNILITITVFLGLIIVILSINLANTNKDSNTTKQNPTTTASDYDVSKFKSVDLNGLKEEIKKDKYTVLYIGRETCSYCKKMIPVLQKGQDEYKYTTLYFDITQIIDFSTGNITNQKVFDEISAFDKEFFKELGATPMMVVFKNNKFVSGKVGYSEYGVFKDFLNNAGIK